MHLHTCRPPTTDDAILSCLSQADLMAYSCTCRQLRDTVALYNQRAYRIELVLGAICQNLFLKFEIDNTVGQYFTASEIIHFRQLQAATGTIISGSTAVQFFDRDVYENSDLDLYVQHRTARPIALWLQTVGYLFVPHQDADFQTLEMGLDKSSERYTVNQFGMPGLTNIHDDSDEGYFNAVVVLDFKKVNHPNIQLITSRGPPLEMILNFHSSEHSNIKNIIPQPRSSLCHEYNHAQQGILHLPPSNIYRAAFTALQW